MTRSNVTPIRTKLAYSVTSAAEVYDVSPDFIRECIYSGALAAKKIGNRWSISADALRKWHDSLPDG